MIEASVEILGQDKAQFMFTNAPTAFANSMKRFMWRERKVFLTSFKKKIMSKPLEGGRTGTWSAQVAGQFKGYVENPDNIQGMALHMGFNLRHMTKPFPMGIAEMEEGFTHEASGIMPIPNYSALASRGLHNSYKLFHQMLDARELEVVPTSTGCLYFEKGPKSGPPLWFGVKRVTVKKQFDFKGEFERRMKNIDKRGETALNATIRGIERGRIDM